jgi:hypothetical protein
MNKNNQLISNQGFKPTLNPILHQIMQHGCLSWKYMQAIGRQELSMHVSSLFFQTHNFPSLIATVE